MTDHTELTREPALSNGDESGIPDDCAADLPSWRKIAPEVWAAMTIEEKIRAIFADVPQEVWDEVPDDLSYQHDHYIYGWPKKP